MTGAEALAGQQEPESGQTVRARMQSVLRWVGGLPRSGNFGESAWDADLLKQFSIPILIKP